MLRLSLVLALLLTLFAPHAWAVPPLHPLAVHDSKGALVGRLAEPGVVRGEFMQPESAVVRAVGSSGTLVPIVVKRDGVVGGTTYPEFVHGTARCASPGVMLWPDRAASLLPPTFTDGVNLTYGVQATTLVQIASVTLYHLPVGQCTGAWQDGTAFPLPHDRCCFTWNQPYAADGASFAVPATLDMGGWNLVPPFHVE
jgi:hypothetical protein